MLSHIARLLFVFFLGVGWWSTYSSINSYNSQPSRAIYLSPRPVDVLPSIIQPATVLIYTVGAVILIVWPLLVCWQWEKFRLMLTAMALGTAVGFVTFLVWPIAIERPNFSGTGVGEATMLAVFSVDEPANCFPSFHAFFAVLGALLIQAFRPELWSRVIAGAIAMGVAISTVTTGQHYVIDAVAGAALAVFAFFVASNLWRKPAQESGK